MEDSTRLRYQRISTKAILSISFIFSLAFVLFLAASFYFPRAIETRPLDQFLELNWKNQIVYVKAYPQQDRIRTYLNVSIEHESYSFKWECTHCTDKLLVYKPYLPEEVFKVTLVIGEDIHSELELGYVNSGFSLFLVLLKSGLSLVSVLSLVSLTWNMVKSYVWSFESKFIYALSVSLLLFNDPLYLLSLAYPSLWTNAISLFSIWQFVFLLLLFWMSLFHKVLLDTVSFVFNTVFFFVIGIPFWGIFIGMLYFHVQLNRDPTWIASINEVNIAKTVIGMALTYMLVMVLCFIGAVLCVNLRHQEKGIISVSLLAMALACIGIGAVQYVDLTVLIVGFCSIFNFYVVYLSIMFAPVVSPNNFYECDTPGFEMKDLRIQIKELVKDQLS